MRYLNKVIFLNSAHIPYAEIRVDGNVHFIGTQGVGKSTLLRAILFFYNADKLHLGIPKEKQNFDAFYLPYANSYIVYEVVRENSAYSVVVSKSMGRAAFRLIDAPYRKAWFVNDRHEVSADWSEVRTRILESDARCTITPLVTSYEMFRDIIFGNNRKPDMVSYRKFAIVESSKYQNIPRTIQHVFLNSRLDADFVKDTINSPFFRKGDDRKYSYEDVNLVKKDDTYYLFCNQWYWEDQQDPKQNGTFLATSKDLRHWDKVGIVFPEAKRTHRNGVVLQNPHNEAVKVNGKYIMYLNDGLIAYSDDLIHWESKENPHRWPGGEGCFALCDHTKADPDRIILFTGGNHTGHFYAIGEVLLSKKDPEKPIDYLPAPVLAANPHYPYENGYTADAPFRPISAFSDCIFFNGLTLHDGQWWFYYGGSEYYTCLAHSPYQNK